VFLVRDRFLTFLYLPDGASEPRTLRVRRNVVVSLVVTVLVALGVSGWMVLHYSSRLKDAYQVEVLETQNRELRTDVSSLEREVETLRRQVDRISISRRRRASWPISTTWPRT
jgi:cell division protein FtsB